MDAIHLEPAVRPEHATAPAITAHWLGRIAYRDAWALQKRLARARAADRFGDRLLLLEHPAVLTLGRGANESHVLATPAELDRRGIELLRVERGGEVTYHGPGQLVAYPIIKLADRELLLRPFVRALEAALVTTCMAFGVTAVRRDGHPGCWVAPESPMPRKIGALGLRVERGVTYHGIALNVSVDLRDFDLIDPCGMPGLTSASVLSELGVGTEPPSTDDVAMAARTFALAFAGEIGAPLMGNLPPVTGADPHPAAELAALEALLAAAEATHVDLDAQTEPAPTLAEAGR